MIVVDVSEMLEITRYPQNLLLPRVWELRHNLTAYDCSVCRLSRDAQGAAGHL